MNRFIYARIQSRKGLNSSMTVLFTLPATHPDSGASRRWHEQECTPNSNIELKVACSKDEKDGTYTFKFPLKPTDDSTMIQEAFYLHFDHFKISENELSKKRLQPQDQPSRLQILADFEKYNDLQAISNLASVVQSKSLAEKSKEIQNDFNQSHETTNQYRSLESDFHSNNDLIWSLSNRLVDRKKSKPSHLP